MLQIEIDGKQVSVEQGATVIEAAHKLGTYIPHFCYHKKLSIAANCRMCLVDVEKAPKPLPACAGMTARWWCFDSINYQLNSKGRLKPIFSDDLHKRLFIKYP